MHRLGLVDVGSPGEGREVVCLPASSMPRDLESRYAAGETGKLKITSQGKIVAAPHFPRAARYQLARFCEWEDQGPDGYRYHISPRSLDAARRQGLKVEQLLALLARHVDAGIPTSVTKAVTTLGGTRLGGAG